MKKKKMIEYGDRKGTMNMKSMTLKREMLLGFKGSTRDKKKRKFRSTYP